MIVIGAIVIVLVGVLLVYLGKSLEPNQRVVLVLIALLVTAVMIYGGTRAYHVGAQMRHEPGR